MIVFWMAAAVALVLLTQLPRRWPQAWRVSAFATGAAIALGAELLILGGQLAHITGSYSSLTRIIILGYMVYAHQDIKRMLQDKKQPDVPAEDNPPEA